MNTFAPEHGILSAAVCREALGRFWTENVRVEANQEDFALALPLLLADGWQVTISVEPFAEASVMLTDKGRTLRDLFEEGVNWDARAKATHDLLEKRKAEFGLVQDGFELKKVVSLPLDGTDVHVFAEALVSISYLVYRAEPQAESSSVGRDTLLRVLRERGIEPRLDAALAGQIEKRIRVDCLVQNGRHPLAFKVVNRSGPILSYVEQWAWRWMDLRNANPGLRRGMVYNPDIQDWDETTLAIGRSACEFLVPYFDTDAINAALDRAA